MREMQGKDYPGQTAGGGYTQPPMSSYIGRAAHTHTVIEEA